MIEFVLKGGEKTMGQSLRLARELDQTLLAVQQLEDYWNEKLSLQWPLSPRDLRGRGLIHYDNYKKQSGLFGAFCTITMMKELRSLAKEAGFEAKKPWWIEVCGIGLASRDLRWLGSAVDVGFNLRARDISSVAIERARKVFHEYISNDRLDVIAGEIEDTWESIPIDPKKTVVYFASQFFQIFSRKKMRKTLGHLGHILGQCPKGSRIKPRIYLVHPLPEDNTGPKSWNGVDLPGVQWGDTTPYSLEELREAVERQLEGKKVAIEALSKQLFYHQTYTFLKITIAS